MTAKEYLSQAQRLDMRINSQIEQMESLKGLASKCTSALREDSRQVSSKTSRLEDIVIKVITLQEALQADVLTLIELKREIIDKIKQVPDVEQRILLEKRYLCFTSWERITVDLGYSIQHTYRLHGQALKIFSEILKDESK